MEETYKLAYDLGYLQSLKDFANKLHLEVREARESNFNAKAERVENFGREDDFTIYCDGKIHALDGIDYFTDDYVIDTISSKKLQVSSFYGVMLGIKRKEQERFTVDIENFKNLVTVVRCKDCKHYNNQDINLLPHCTLSGITKFEDDFCSDGERRKEQ